MIFTLVFCLTKSWREQNHFPNDNLRSYMVYDSSLSDEIEDELNFCLTVLSPDHYAMHYLCKTKPNRHIIH